MAKKASTPASQTADASHRIVVLVGKELFLQTEHVARLREHLNAAFGDVETVRFDGAATPAADVLDECRTFGLVQQHKLVVVDNADQFVKEANRPLVERYAQSPCENATLVLRCDKWNKGNLDKQIGAVGVFVKCEPVEPDKAAMWAVARCRKRYERDLQPAAAQALVERLGTDLGRIDSEVAKLTLAVEAGRPITREDVGEHVGLTREEEAWGVQRTLLSGDPQAALRHLRLILDNSRRDAHIPVGFAFMDLARKLHGASRGLRQGAREWDLAGPLKLWGDSKEAVLGAAKRIEPARAAGLLAATVQADVKAKTGVGDPVRTLEALALRFTAAARGR